MLYTIGLHTRYVYVCTCMMSVSDHPACVSSLCGACDGRFDVCMRCCERSGLLGLWGCGPVSSPVIVPVRCLRAVKKVESSRVLCGCPIWDLLCVSAPVWRSVQGPIARPPGFLPAPNGVTAHVSKAG